MCLLRAAFKGTGLSERSPGPGCCSSRSHLCIPLDTQGSGHGLTHPHHGVNQLRGGWCDPRAGSESWDRWVGRDLKAHCIPTLCLGQEQLPAEQKLTGNIYGFPVSNQCAEARCLLCTQVALSSSCNRCCGTAPECIPTQPLSRRQRRRTQPLGHGWSQARQSRLMSPSQVGRVLVSGHLGAIRIPHSYTACFPFGRDTGEASFLDYPGILFGEFWPEGAAPVHIQLRNKSRCTQTPGSLGVKRELSSPVFGASVTSEPKKCHRKNIQ